MTTDRRERDSILRDLCSDDEEVRRLAVERSAVLAVEEVVPLLVERLGDASWRVRKAAVERLAATPDPDSIARALIAALADGENPGRRNAAVDALIQCGSRVIPRLVDALGAADVDVRKFAVDVMAGIGDASASGALIERLDDADANVRAAAADALGAIGGADAVTALVHCAVSDDQDPLVRFSALHALADLSQGVPARQLASALADPILRPAALDVLGHVEDDGEAVDVLVKALEDRSRSSREAVMRALLQRLASLEPSEADSLAQRVREVAARSPELVVSAIERLSEVDLPTRLVLIQFLGVVRAPESAVPILLAGADEALQQVALSSLVSMGSAAADAINEVWPDLGVETRRDACAFFGHCDAERTEERLLAALEDTDPLVRSEAARSLGLRESFDAVAAMVRRLHCVCPDDIDAEDERAALTDALIAIAGAERARGRSRAVELMVQAIEGASEPVRVAIAQVMGAVGSADDREVVSLLLKDASSQVRRAAVDALGRLAPDAAAEPLHLAIADESVDVRIAAASVLGARAGSGALLDLCRLSEDADARVRAMAIAALGRLRAEGVPAEHRDLLERVLDAACGDEVPVALAAIESAREHGGPLERVEALLHRNEPEVVREAVRCLGVRGEGRDLEAIIPMAAHPDWSVRAEAIEVLSERGVARALPAILRRLEREQDEFVRGVILRALPRLED